MLRVRRPAAPLDSFVERLWMFEGFTQPHAKERIMPDGAMTLIVNLREDCTRIYDRRDFDRCERLNGAIVSGSQSEFFVIDTAGQFAVAGVQFKPGGAFPFSDPPPGELHGLHVPLDALWGNFARELRERLLGASPDSVFDIMETALGARVRRPLERHPAVSYALREMLAAPHLTKIAEVVERTGLSGRRFIELFRRETGLTPKLFCRVQRFQRALRGIAAGRPVEWSQVALDGGYFDQAHFIHDFRAFSGMNPSACQGQRRHQNHVPIVEATAPVATI